MTSPDVLSRQPLDMAGRVRAHDWSTTSLGAIDTWPARVRAIVDLVLASPLVSSVALLDDRLLIYNDAAAQLYGDRHPAALGRPLAEGFADSYPDVAALYDRVFAGEAVQICSQPLAVSAAGGEAFDAYLTPVRDAEGVVIGAHMVGLEVGGRLRSDAALRDSEERQTFLLDLSDTLRPLADPDEIMFAASRSLGRHLGAGRCGYGEVDRSGEIFVVARDWTDGTMASFAGRHRLVSFGPEFAKAYRAGRSVLIVDALADARAAGAEAVFEAAGGVRASLGVPLIKDGVFIAGLFVQQIAPRRWTAADETLARDVVDRTWAAVERARAEARLRDREMELAFTQRIGQVANVEVILSDPPFGRRSLEYRRLHGLPADRIIETHEQWLARIHPDDREREAHDFWSAVEGSDTFESEYRIIRPSDGVERWISAKGVIERDTAGKATRMLGAHIDVTDRKHATAALRTSEARLQVLMEGIPQLVWRAVDGGQWTWASPQWTDFTGQPEAESHGYGWLDPVHPDDRAGVRKVWSRAMKRGAFEADYRLLDHRQQRYRWFQTRATPVRDDDGAIVEWLGTSTDVEDLRVLQERQGVLLAELQHRVRNILAIIRAILRRSRDSAESLQDYAQHLEGRVAALARTQVLLTRRVDARVDLQELIRDELAAQAADDKRITIEGPDIDLAPKAAEVLALAIHELATNAMKYGAIADPAATLRIAWRTEQRDAEQWVLLDWIEHGVSAMPRPPQRVGFGTELITRRVPYELRGEGTLEAGFDGVVCAIAFPLIDRASILQTDDTGTTREGLS